MDNGGEQRGQLAGMSKVMATKSTKRRIWTTAAFSITAGALPAARRP